MSLTKILKALDDLSGDELRELRPQIDRRTGIAELRAGTMDVDALLRAIAAINEGMNEAERKALTDAMNDE